MLVEIPRGFQLRGIGQFNCDKRSQQPVEAIYGTFFLSVLHVPPEKHPTENGEIAGKLLSHLMILEIKKGTFSCTCAFTRP